MICARASPLGIDQIVQIVVGLQNRNHNTGFCQFQRYSRMTHRVYGPSGGPSRSFSRIAPDPRRRLARSDSRRMCQRVSTIDNLLEGIEHQQAARRVG